MFPLLVLLATLLAGSTAIVFAPTPPSPLTPPATVSATERFNTGFNTGQPDTAQPDTARWLDPIARLQRRIDDGSVRLAHDDALGYLPALLQALDIPVSSQGLVFSRTSLQTDRIAPWAPRALYFNDDVYVGYVLGSTFLEIAAVHPTQGAVFYTLQQDERSHMVFEQEGRTCLMCHQSRSATGGVSGFMVLSTLADRHGYPIAGVQEGPMTDATPWDRRWGGWYVTGTHGATGTDGAGHAGNVYSPQLVHEVVDRRRYLAGFALTNKSALKDVSNMLDTTRYLSAHSDIVALSVLVHQTVVHNLITALHEASARLPDVERGTNAALPAGHPDVVRAQAAAHRLADAMLFARAAPLAGPLRGTTRFATEFAQRGPRDEAGRSLRDLDLERRLFRYPLSFLIYSESFAALTDEVRRMVYGRIAAVLNGAPPDVADSARLTEGDRRAITEILRATLPDYSHLLSDSPR